MSTPDPFFNRRVIVMGVSGSGKSSIGEGIGHILGVAYIDGDAYHSTANVQKMARGEPLTDADRANWLNALVELIAEYRQRGSGVLIGCSALKRQYRDQLRTADPDLSFLFLDGDYDLIRERMQQRQHFFSPALLQSQFDTLERPSPDEAISIDIGPEPDRVIRAGADALWQAN